MRKLFYLFALILCVSCSSGMPNGIDSIKVGDSYKKISGLLESKNISYNADSTYVFSAEKQLVINVENCAALIVPPYKDLMILFKDGKAEAVAIHGKNEFAEAEFNKKKEEFNAAYKKFNVLESDDKYIMTNDTDGVILYLKKRTYSQEITLLFGKKNIVTEMLNDL